MLIEIIFCLDWMHKLNTQEQNSEPVVGPTFNVQ